MTLEEEVAMLRAENLVLRQQVTSLLEHGAALQAQLATTHAELAAAQARIAELEDRPKGPPAFGKANMPKRAQAPPQAQA